MDRAEGEPWANSLLSTEPNAGVNSGTLRSWPEPKSRVHYSTNWATRVLWSCNILKTFKFWLDDIFGMTENSKSRKEHRVKSHSSTLISQPQGFSPCWQHLLLLFLDILCKYIDLSFHISNVVLLLLIAI